MRRIKRNKRGKKKNKVNKEKEVIKHRIGCKVRKR